jgi:hypothetical protein
MIVDPEFEDGWEKVAKIAPIWVINTKKNRAASSYFGNARHTEITASWVRSRLTKSPMQKSASETWLG